MAVYSGIGDLTFAIIPWWILRKVQIRPAEKIGVAVAMSMGVFAAICAFIKASLLQELAGPDFSCMSHGPALASGVSDHRADQR